MMFHGVVLGMVLSFLTTLVFKGVVVLEGGGGVGGAFASILKNPTIKFYKFV